MHTLKVIWFCLLSLFCAGGCCWFLSGAVQMMIAFTIISVMLGVALLVIATLLGYSAVEYAKAAKKGSMS